MSTKIAVMHQIFYTMTSHYVLAIAISLLVGCIYLVILPKHRRDAFTDQILAKLQFLPRGRRTSSSKTPPRSISPEKKVPNNEPPPVEYKNIFPPFQRETLSKVAKRYPSPMKENLPSGEVDDVTFRKNIIPFTANYEDCGPSTYTPMGLSVAEVKALGDFPDYAELSGVPRPNPYQEFRIDTAVARPYRPFRWAYHQTMCTSSLL